MILVWGSRSDPPVAHVLRALCEDIGRDPATIVMSVGMAFMYPALMALSVNSVPDEERVAVISTFTMFFEIGSMFGGLVLGLVAELTSKRGGFLGGAVSCALGLWVLWRVLLPSVRAETSMPRVMSESR